MTTTSKRNYFGKGSVVVASDGEGAVRRLAITADKLVVRPFEGIDVIPDILAYAARTHGTREAMGWRNVVSVHEEEKQVKKTVGGKEVVETKKWKYFELSDYEYISFLEVQERVLELARGLVHHGLGKEDVFSIYAQTSANWQLVSHACAVISTPVAAAYDALGEADLAHSLNEPDCAGIFTNADLLPVLARIIKDTPSVRLVVYDGDVRPVLLDDIRSVREGIVVVSIDKLRATGRALPLSVLEDSRPTPDDVALVMYTSGSTGAPKGVVLTHGNVVASVGGVYHLLGHHLLPDDTFLAYLPLAHIYEYVVELSFFMLGIRIGYGRVKTLTDASVRNCKGDIVAFRPSILVGVPQIWETIRKGILAKVNASGNLRKTVFNGAMAVMKANVPVLTDIADSVALSQVRAATGGRLRLAMSGGAALSKETQEFLSVARVTILQGYGMTESCAMCAILPPELMQYGSVGLPVPCVEIKLSNVPEAGYRALGMPPQGEICIRGPSVTRGYYKRPDLNEDETIFTKDGWLRTGDIGQWNPDGTLTLIDRIENLVKLQGGEYIPLGRLEATYRACSLVYNICVHASAEAKQPIAIVVPHEPNLRYVLTQRPLPGVDSTAPLADLCRDEVVQGLVMKECNVLGKRNDLKPVEMLEAVILTADEWTPESGLVTAVQKVQRSKIAQHFERLIKTRTGDVAKWEPERTLSQVDLEHPKINEDRYPTGFEDQITEMGRSNTLSDNDIDIVDSDARKQIVDLQRELTNSRSRINKLERDYEIQLTELDSLREQLRAREVDDNAIISSLEAQVGEWKEKHGVAGDELKTAHNTIEQLRRDQDLASSRSKTGEGQIRRELQSNVLYGVNCALPVDTNDEEHMRRKDLWETDPTGALYVPGYFETKVRMGGDPHEEKQFRDAYSLIESDPGNFTAQEVGILCYRGSLSDPKWVDEDEPSFSVLCNVDVDLSEAVKDLVMETDDSGHVYYQLNYDVIVWFGRTDIRAEVCWILGTGERRAPAKIRYGD